ncbi:MAG: hypothetical protein ONA69_08055, partial [candidate division KSB1 bacterium]|nr:hypothetical protein [candidate division KSB1 bacterium]
PVRSRWLIGSCRRNELLQILERVGQEWVKGVNRLEQKILDEIRSADFVTPDPVINKTMRWSKATVVALHHYMDGRLVPMPCPAEYNFFFTHDFLLTGLGAGVYSREFLQNGYDFLLSKTESDSLLPHAYYWKDGRYVTEKCAADNWNHLWFIISAGTYLKHTGDRETIGRLYPVLQKSLRSALQNLGDDRLMYSSRPDWWDIGNLYGARAYLTVLTIRALQEFVSLSWMIGASCPDDSLLGLAESMKTALTQKLWCDELGYLINGLDRASLDYHYYSGSLLACLFDAIDDGKKLLLINTARQKLFDPRLGIRNAWPPDFHKLIKVYRFNGLEVGLPYYYFNGGIWMHGNAWYALSLIEAGQIDEAVQFVKAIMTPDGVRNSPKGQPSFYEYRMSDPTDSLYGAVDKPNFLWAAGWAIQTLYRLAGLRLDPWQISFSAHLPFGWKQIEYELLLYGTLCRVRCSGNGRFFRRIEIDGQQSCSAVLNRPAKNILLQRGKPIVPYLAAVTGRLQTVSYHPHDRCLVIETAYVTGQAVRLTVVSPWPLQRILVNGKEPNQVAAWKEEEGAYAIKIENTCRSTSERFSLFF